jgi:hypothetical protein
VKQLKTLDRKIGGFVFLVKSRHGGLDPLSLTLVEKIPGGETVRDELFDFGRSRILQVANITCCMLSSVS